MLEFCTEKLFKIMKKNGLINKLDETCSYAMGFHSENSYGRQALKAYLQQFILK